MSTARVSISKSMLSTRCCASMTIVPDVRPSRPCSFEMPSCSTANRALVRSGSTRNAPAALRSAPVRAERAQQEHERSSEDSRHRARDSRLRSDERSSCDTLRDTRAAHRRPRARVGIIGSPRLHERNTRPDRLFPARQRRVRRADRAPAPATTDWLERSLRAVWHPCTQMKQHETLPLVPIARGDGAWLYDFDGRRYLDAVSSWWVNLFGHANPRIGAAIAAQLDELEHVMLAGFTHRPVVELSERLAALAPGHLGHAFYGSDGAAATEIALKMAFHYWKNRGRPGKDALSLARRRLSRRDAGRARGDRRADLSRHLFAAPQPQHDRAVARCARRAAGRIAARRRHSRRRRARGASRPPSRDDRRVHRRAAGAGRVGNGDARSALPHAGARALHALRRAPDRRRDHDGLRPHRNDVRLRRRPGSPPT